MKRRAARAAAVALLLCVTAHAAADPAPAITLDLTRPLQTLSPSTLTTDGGTVLRLTPGRFLAEPVWSKLDLELKRLQDAETRLTAENTSFRATAASWQPGWYTLAVAVTSGIVLGVYLDRKL